MGLLEQMQAVDRLVRSPDGLQRLDAADPADRAVLETIDRRRLDAVARGHARLILGRWWAPRFPGTLQALGDDAARATLARALVGSPRFEQALEEDLLGTVFVPVLLDLLEGERLPEAAEWTRDVLVYEYLLGIGLPRRGRAEACDLAVEERLLDEQVSFLSGGRLSVPVAVATFDWPVAALHEGLPLEEADDPPEAVVFMIEPDGVVEVEAPACAGDALDLLAQGASDKVLAQALDEEWRPLRSWLREVGLVAR